MTLQFRECTVPIPDPADQPIVDAAVAGTVDVIVTGDKVFLALAVDRPRIRTPREFLVADSSW